MKKTKLFKRLLFLDVINSHLKLQYNTTETRELNSVNDVKSQGLSTLTINEDGLAVTTGTFEVNKTVWLTNFNDSSRHDVNYYETNGYLPNVTYHNDPFWRILLTNSVEIVYSRKQYYYSEWAQFLGPLTLSKYDKFQIQFECLKGKGFFYLLVLTYFEDGLDCPQGYNGLVPHCQDRDECGYAYLNECDRTNARCINIIGGYICECRDGFYGNGLSCSSKFCIRK